MLTPGTSRERASEAAAVIGLEWTCWAVRKWCDAEDEADEARMKGSKCSLRRSNSRLSGAESSCFWSWSRAFIDFVRFVRSGIDLSKKARTCETCRFLEGDPHFRRVPATVTTIQEERWVSEGVYRHYPTIWRFWGVGRHHDQGVLA